METVDRFEGFSVLSGSNPRLAWLVRRAFIRLSGLGCRVIGVYNMMSGFGA